MSTSDDLRRFNEKLEQDARAVFVNSTVKVQGSMVEGSALTGAPGQPVDIGTLRGSFVDDFVTATLWRSTTHLIYAPLIEDGVGKYGPLTLRSEVGGWHSVKLTRAGWPQIVEETVAEVAQ